MRTSYKTIFIILLIIFIIGIIIGVLFMNLEDESTKEIILLNVNSYIENKNVINNIVIHFIIISSLLISGIFLIGIPLNIFFIFFNGFSIGFNIAIFVNIFSLKGLLYGIIYNIITNGLYIIFIILLCLNIIKLSKNIIDVIIFKSNNNYIYLYLKRNIIFILLIFINDIILYFIGNYLINLFNFLII